MVISTWLGSADEVKIYIVNEGCLVEVPEVVKD